MKSMSSTAKPEASKHPQIEIFHHHQTASNSWLEKCFKPGAYSLFIVSFHFGEIISFFHLHFAFGNERERDGEMPFVCIVTKHVI
jgi:hypothetical protein